MRTAAATSWVAPILRRRFLPRPGVFLCHLPWRHATAIQRGADVIVWHRDIGCVSMTLPRFAVRLVRGLVGLPAVRDADILAIAKEKGLDRFTRWVKVWSGALANSAHMSHAVCSAT